MLKLVDAVKFYYSNEGQAFTDYEALRERIAELFGQATADRFPGAVVDYEHFYLRVDFSRWWKEEMKKQKTANSALPLDSEALARAAWEASADIARIKWFDFFDLLLGFRKERARKAQEKKT